MCIHIYMLAMLEYILTKKWIEIVPAALYKKLVGKSELKLFKAFLDC